MKQWDTLLRLFSTRLAGDVKRGHGVSPFSHFVSHKQLQVTSWFAPCLSSLSSCSLLRPGTFVRTSPVQTFPSVPCEPGS